MPNADEKLPGGESDLFKTGTGIAHYLSKKRSDIQFAVKECRREGATPTRPAQARLMRVARYLVTHRKVVVIRFPLWTSAKKYGPKRIRVFVDASHAGCARTRKSTSSGIGTR